MRELLKAPWSNQSVSPIVRAGAWFFVLCGGFALLDAIDVSTAWRGRGAWHEGRRSSCKTARHRRSGEKNDLAGVGATALANLRRYGRKAER